MSNNAKCDVLVTPQHEVFINGTEIGWVMDLNMSVDSRGPELVLTMRPTSIMHGDAPIQTVAALHDSVVNNDDALKNGGTSVDIAKAIANAKARQAGILPTAPPVAQQAKPVMARKTNKKYNAVVAEEEDTPAPSYRDTRTAGNF